MAIIVSIPRQRVYVYRNGLLIGVSTCSTGKPGHDTPTGVFTVLQKAKTHTSNKYDEAMPDMERLTWQGIALHVGDSPATRHRMAACTFRKPLPIRSMPRRRSARR